MYSSFSTPFPFRLVHASIVFRLRILFLIAHPSSPVPTFLHRFRPEFFVTLLFRFLGSCCLCIAAGHPFLLLNTSCSSCVLALVD